MNLTEHTVVSMSVAFAAVLTKNTGCAIAVREGSGRGVTNVFQAFVPKKVAQNVAKFVLFEQKKGPTRLRKSLILLW